MRLIAVFAALFVFSVGPVLAQEPPDAARTRQLELAGRYLELTQGADTAKLIREQIEEGYGDAELPADQRAWLTDQMTSMFEEALSAAIVEIRDDVADTFTTAELEAAVAFYDTPMGRSIARKDLEMSAAMQQAMMPHLLTRITSMSEKFCQRFDCTAMGETAAKSRS
ncbi:MAG: DUF2059 domain-containing protein [Brevundimonas sp.]|nr:MAG: DUF2059 domain-containing protein [Brevundimonas sp.]